MEDWKKRIVDKIKQHNERKAEIQNALNKLLEELEREKVAGVSFDRNSEYPLAWTVSINRKSVVITENDVEEHQRIYQQDEYGQLIEDENQKKSVRDALIEILVKHFG